MALLVSRSGFDAARAAFFEKLYQGRSVLCVGLGDGAMLDILCRRGAGRVAGVDLDEAVVQAARERLGSRVALKVGLLGEAASLGAPFDVVLVRRGETMVVRELWRDVARLVAPHGWLIAAALAGDRPEALRGAMRYEQLRDHLAAYFPHVTMLAQTAFVGATVIPFVDGEVEPRLDTALADDAAPALYLAVAGAEPLASAYGIIELPRAATAPMAASELAVPPFTPTDGAAAGRAAAQAAELSAVRQQLAERQGAVARLEAERSTLAEQLARRGAAPPPAPAAGEREQVARLEQAVEAAQTAALVHAREMRRIEATLAERDGYVAELERDARSIEEMREAARQAAARAEAAEARERAARRRVAELEGTVVRLSAEAGQEPPPSLAAGAVAAVDSDAQAAELARQAAELEARCARLQQKADEAQREAWGHLKARSEAEAAAAEVREDTVRKLKDARKIANAELMRAMEEATRKAVTLKEDLVRAERERNDARVALQAAQFELAQERAAIEERVRQAAAEEASRILALLEARLEQAEAERDRALKLASAASVPPSPESDPSPMAASAAEMEQLLAGLDDALSGEADRVLAVEEGLRRALHDLRSGDGEDGEAGGNGGGPGG